MNNIRKACLCWAMSLMPALAADWPPVLPEVWAMKEDPAKGIKDAVILENRTLLKNTSLERIIRLRILSEAGRKAVELDAFSDACYDFDGRTVCPDGKVLKFDKRQDFSKETVKVGSLSEKRTIAIPPGVNANCVVELRWSESLGQSYVGRHPLPERMGYATQFMFGASYLTLLETVEISIPFPWNLVAQSGQTQKLEEVKRSGFRVYSAQNLPAVEHPPFSLDVLQDRPVVSIFMQPKLLSSRIKASPQDYWNGVGRVLWKDGFESADLRKGRHYEALRAKLVAGIPTKEPLALASALVSALEKEIVNLSHLTFEEMANRPEDQKQLEITDLGELCRGKAASGWGMTLLFYHMLKDSGLQPKLALLADREVQLFQAQVYNPWQATHVAVVVEEPGKGAQLYDLSQRFGAPGLIHPSFQGVQGMLVDPKNDWSGHPFAVPIQPANFNQKRYEYSLDLGEEERFKVNAQFSGFPELEERRRFDKDEPKERDRNLKEGFEHRLKGTTILRSEVQNPNDPAVNVAWFVEGQREAEESRVRHIDPFPGLTYPVSIPDAMPTERGLPIVMPYLQVQLAPSTFKIPKGYRAQLGQPSHQKNSFGSVAWVAELKKQGQDDQVTVVMKVTVDTMFAPPTAYEELKTYLNWIQEAFKRTVVLEKA